MKKVSSNTPQDWETAVSWCDNHCMVTGTYTSEEISVLRLLLQIDGIADPYVIIIAPSTEPGVLEVWLSQQGYGDVIPLFGLHAKKPEDLVDSAVENAMRYIAGSLAESTDA